MANENQYYKFPFAEDGNFSVIPDQASGGSVDYESGFGPDYEKVSGETDRKLIERESFNGLMNGATKNIKQWQEYNYPTWIEDNGDGAPFTYLEGAIVRHNSKYWVATEDSSIEPSAVASTWREFNPNGSLEVEGEGGALTQSLTELQSVVNKSETFQNATPISSTQSVTLPNGLIMKFGVFMESVNSSDSRSWDTPFPNGVLSMTVTPNTDSGAIGGVVVSYNSSDFVFKSGGEYGDGQTAFVQAIGY